MVRKGKVIVYMSHLVRDKENARAEFPQPVVSVLDGKRTMYVNEVEVMDKDGNVVCRVVYDPNKDPSPHHKVSAWVEIDKDAADVRYR